MTVASLPDDSDLRRLAWQHIPPGAREPFGAYIFHSDEPGAELARAVERAVFLEAFDNTPDLLAREYGPYESGSVFICVLDHLRGVPAGMMRVLMSSPAGFKSLNDIETVWGESAEDVLQRTGLALDAGRTWMSLRWPSTESIVARRHAASSRWLSTRLLHWLPTPVASSGSSLSSTCPCSACCAGSSA